MGNNLANNRKKEREANKGNIINKISLQVEFTGECLDVCLLFPLKGELGYLFTNSRQLLIETCYMTD